MLGRIGRLGLDQDEVRMWAAQAREVFHAPVRVFPRQLRVDGINAQVWVAVVYDGAHRAATAQEGSK